MTAAAAPQSAPLSLPSHFWADLSTRDFAALQHSGQADQVVAVLPVAAVEQHGPHLPLSVDATLLQGVIDAALPQLPADLPVLFLPSQNVGLSPEHIRFPGTLTLSPATVIALWTEIGECVARAGVKKLLLFNGHGGQVSVMDIVARELRTRCNLIVYSASWFSLPLPVLFLPPQNVGLSPEHIRFPGTLTLSPATVIALWTEIGECVARAGVKKLLLFNGHGGQVSVMDIVARELRTRCDLLVYSASWFSLPLPEAVASQFSAQEHRFGIHAGEIETSMMRHLAPGTVHMEHAQDFRSTAQDRAEQFALLGNGKTAKLGWQMQDYHPAGAVGNAAAATAEKGWAVVDAAAVQLVALLRELQALPLSTLRSPTLG